MTTFLNMLTIRVPCIDLRDATAFSIDVVGSTEQGHCPLYEPHAAGQVQGRVPLPIAHQWVGIGLQEVLDHLVLTGQDSKMEGRLGGGGGGGGGERWGGAKVKAEVEVE